MGRTDTFELTALWTKPNGGRAQDFARALDELLNDGRTASGTWVVNSGLWHLEGVAHSLDWRHEYETNLQTLFSVLDRTEGRKIWRSTTAVRPQNMPEDVE